MTVQVAFCSVTASPGSQVSVYFLMQVRAMEELRQRGAKDGAGDSMPCVRHDHVDHHEVCG